MRRLTRSSGFAQWYPVTTVQPADRDTPDCVVLLDEFEKAHPEVRFLTACNDGFVTEVSDAARVPTNEAIFILTTNAASPASISGPTCGRRQSRCKSIHAARYKLPLARSALPCKRARSSIHVE